MTAGVRRSQPDLDRLATADRVAKWSPRQGGGVGALLLSPDRSSMVWGYTRPPMRVRPEAGGVPDEFMLHAELVAREQVKGPLYGWTLYVSKFPCSTCAASLIEAGVTRVVSRPPDVQSRWRESQEIALDMFEASGVEVTWCDC